MRWLSRFFNGLGHIATGNWGDAFGDFFGPAIRTLNGPSQNIAPGKTGSQYGGSYGKGGFGSGGVGGGGTKPDDAKKLLKKK